MAQGVSLKQVANSELRRLWACNGHSDCADAGLGPRFPSSSSPVGEAILESDDGRIAPKWRGPAAILESDETSVAAKFHGQTFRVA